MLLKVGKYDVASDGTILFEGNRLGVSVAFQEAQHGAKVPLLLWRDGTEVKTEVEIFVYQEDKATGTNISQAGIMDSRANASPEDVYVWKDGGAEIVLIFRDGKVVSRAIKGGVSQRVTKGDFVMIPEGVPHYITEANPQVIFIAIEFPRPRAAHMPTP